MSRLLTLTLVFYSLSAHAFWWDDYKQFGGWEHTLNRNALVFGYHIMSNPQFNHSKENLKTLKQISDEIHYPYITFYAEPELKTIIAKIDQNGLSFKDKIVCPPLSFSGIATLCANPLMKFMPPTIYSTAWNVTVEFDREFRSDILETSYEGSKLYFKLSASIGQAKKAEFDLKQMSPDMAPLYPKITGGTKALVEGANEDMIFAYWIRPSSKSLRDEFYATNPSSVKLLDLVLSCINKKDYSCIFRADNGELEAFFEHLYTSFAEEGWRKYGPWFYQTPSMLIALKECLLNGEVISVKMKEKGWTANNKIVRSDSLHLSTSETWESGDGIVRDRLRCGIKIGEDKVGEKWVPREPKLTSSTQEYL